MLYDPVRFKCFAFGIYKQFKKKLFQRVLIICGFFEFGSCPANSVGSFHLFGDVSILKHRVEARCENGTTTLNICAAISWRPVQGAPCLSPKESWDSPRDAHDPS